MGIEKNSIHRSPACIAIIICLSAFFLMAEGVSAATLSISPAAGQYQAGETFTLTVRVSSPTQAINAVSGVVKFPTDAIQVVSLSKTASIINLWVQEPAFSNTAGTVNFEGVVLNPGFTGSGGSVASITFKAKNAGSAAVSLSGGSVLANDGNGTEVLTGTSGTTVTINDAKAADKEPVTSKPTTPSHPTTQETTISPTSKKEAVVAAELEAPVITYRSEHVGFGERGEITGASIYPGARAVLTLRDTDGASYETDSVVGSNGVFTIAPSYVTAGTYTGSVVIEKDDLQSSPSESFTIDFARKPLGSEILDLLRKSEILFMLVPLLAFILGMFSVWALLARRTRDPKIRHVLLDVDAEVHHAFLALRQSVNEAIEEFERAGVRRRLTPAEEKFVREMTGRIKETERIIEKELKS